MDTNDFLDLFVGQLPLDTDSRRRLKAKITIYSFERAALELADDLTADEAEELRAFFAEPTPAHAEVARDIFHGKERRRILTVAIAEIIEDILADPDLIEPARGQRIMQDLLDYTSSRNLLAA